MNELVNELHSMEPLTPRVREEGQLVLVRMHSKGDPPHPLRPLRPLPSGMFSVGCILWEPTFFATNSILSHPSLREGLWSMSSMSASRAARTCSSTLFAISCRRSKQSGAGNGFPPQEDFFRVFDIERSFKLDPTRLSLRFKALQRQHHPDMFGTRSEEEREMAANRSSLINKAYQTLLEPYRRGQYLLKLSGREVEEDDSEVQLDMVFLTEMMDVNEDIARRDAERDELIILNEINEKKRQATIKEISEAFEDNNLLKAKQLLAKLRFYNNAAEKIKERL